uniref:Agenet domain-containing protein n=1 Tax=Vitis vinifera TaxID=29760 RepID=F6HH68_VITVI
MRFKKGSKVEVLSKRKVPSGSWISAEIICGNGHNYTVRYDGHQSNIDEAIVERVPGSAIRPCPPPVEGPEGWIPGDIVEVFDNFSWKMATVSKVLGKKYFLVRHLGSSLEFKVRKYDLRVRQSWQDDKWIVIGKSSGTFEDRKPSGPPTHNYIQNSSFQVQEMDTRMKLSRKDNCFTVKNNADFPESRIASSRTLKRGSPFGYSQVEAYAGSAQKFRLTEKEGRLHRAVAANASLLPEKVEAVASPREMLGENYMHASFNSRPTGYSEMDVERAKTNGAVGGSHAGQSMRLVHLASKCLKMMLGFPTFLLV